MKIDGSVGYRPLDKLNRTKGSGKADFAEDIKKSVKSAEEQGKASGVLIPQSRNDSDSAVLNLRAAASHQASAKDAVKVLTRKVLEQPEAVNQRVEEIRNLIAKGGVQAYFATVDSEKVAERLMGSGVLDDLI